MRWNRIRPCIAGLALACFMAGNGLWTEPLIAQDMLGALRSGQSLEEAGEWEKAEQVYEVQAGLNPGRNRRQKDFSNAG